MLTGSFDQWQIFLWQQSYFYNIDILHMLCICQSLVLTLLNISVILLCTFVIFIANGLYVQGERRFGFEYVQFMQPARIHTKDKMWSWRSKCDCSSSGHWQLLQVWLATQVVMFISGSLWLVCHSTSHLQCHCPSSAVFSHLQTHLFRHCYPWRDCIHPRYAWSNTVILDMLTVFLTYFQEQMTVNN